MLTPSFGKGCVEIKLGVHAPKELAVIMFSCQRFSHIIIPKLLRPARSEPLLGVHLGVICSFEYETMSFP